MKRGSLTVWLDQDLEEHWYYEGKAKRGGPYTYSDACIWGLHQLKVVLGLNYRSLEGFACSLMTLLGLKVKVPSYSQLSRRAKKLPVAIGAPKAQGRLFLVFDSTGLKVYGEGEWKVRQ
ncbi:MAG: transposase, partial [Bacteroidia bacterium]|nr:transposase [Bacteroidia bacterium]